MDKNDRRLLDRVEELLPKVKELRKNKDAMSIDDIIEYFSGELSNRDKLNKVLSILKEEGYERPEEEPEKDNLICSECSSDDIEIVLKETVVGKNKARKFKCKKCGYEFYRHIGDMSGTIS